MDLRFFIYVLLSAATIFYFVPVENIQNKDENKDVPLVVFKNPDMYTLTTQKVIRKIQAQDAIKYKNRDEMYNATIVLNNETIESLRANEIINKNELLTLKGDVFYSNEGIMSLKSQELFYKLEDKIVYNHLPYSGTYYKHLLNGKDLYFDSKSKFLKSNKVHFILDVENKNKGL